ncbi:MAG: futalosine hydrolase [Bacteroidota bacterium]
MSVLVVSATALEIEPFLAIHPDADYLITGVGLSSALYHLTKRIHQFDYDMVLQVGLAGTFNDHIKLGTAVVVQKDRFADLGIWQNQKVISVYDLGLSDPNEFPFQEGWLINNQSDKIAVNSIFANALTVNLLTDDDVYIEAMKMKFNADIESMEGAALHFICLQEKIPFLQIRGISNKVGERDKSKWNVKDAIYASNQLLSEIYQSLKK